MQTILIKKVSDKEALEQASAVRYEVFVHGQGVPASLETAHDDMAVHFLALADGVPAGAARYRRMPDGVKLERIAVLPAHRGKKIGDALVKAMLRDLPAGTPVYLYSQVAVTDLYLKNDFEMVGDEFEEAGIKHIKMVWKGGGE
ncbi:GNAT family N-acetyltransferase [Deminuibacter soli]|uniref:GNAT family N-acetyltransferase n=1 Tax=Deminuibacter soli TaxID=2291815 RepID=A0A3E1ND47_9BACT|nr:GNAT family N-acetyltransferase [Deminuibacter soli]RFM25761.1 GNAT family N-acetyltransferase [Deminuibacter soli]